jgi:O-antigen ligase
MSDASQQPPPPPQPSFRGWMGSMWLYTLLRFVMFLVIWGVLVLLGLNGLLGAAIAAVVSVPLSFVLLARPRARFAANLEQRVNAQRARRAEFDTELDPHAHDDSDEDR